MCKSEEDLKSPLVSMFRSAATLPHVWTTGYDALVPSGHEPDSRQVPGQYGCAFQHVHCKVLVPTPVLRKLTSAKSIMAFGQLWGLVTCHSYGDAGMRVSFPMRHMLRLLSDSIGGNIERLSFVQRLRARKLISTAPTDRHPQGYIISNAEDMLSLLDADFGVLVVGDGAKIMGENIHGQETLILADYLRLKQCPHMLASKCLSEDYPDLKLPLGPDIVAGMLYVPLSREGTDFIVFLRQGQLQHVRWAGKPFKGQDERGASLEPRTSFKAWGQTIQGKCREWTSEQLETAGVLALVYGKVRRGGIRQVGNTDQC